MFTARFKRFAHRLRKRKRKHAVVAYVPATSREGGIELAIVDSYNDSWKNTRRGSRLTMVRKPLVQKDHEIMTIGSCFALEIRSALKKKGFDVYPKYREIVFDPNTQKLAKLPARDDVNHYNTFTIRSEFEHALKGGHFVSKDFVFRSVLRQKVFEAATKEIWQDPYRKHVYASSEGAILDLSRKVDACMTEAILRADVYIITLGLTEVWRNDKNGLIVNQVPDGELNGKAPGFTFERSTYEQNYENMHVVCSLVQERFPDKKIVLTVSPVALKRTFSGNDIVVANMESKSTLRAVAAAVSREFSNVIYWPSFEIALARDIYEADGRHVTRAGVDAIVQQFLTTHASQERAVDRTSKEASIFAQ
jgi:GSCFA family